MSDEIRFYKDRIKKLSKAFDDLLDVAYDMRSYVPDFFAQKWSHDERIAETVTAAKEALEE